MFFISIINIKYNIIIFIIIINFIINNYIIIITIKSIIIIDLNIIIKKFGFS